MRLLSVVVPCRDEAANLGRLHEALDAATAGLGWDIEVILVDDGSTDDTVEVAESLVEQDPRVRLLTLSRNFGKEAAMLAGLDDAGGDAVVLMDADLQHPPELLPQIVAAHEAGFDHVVARRSRKGDPALRTLLARGYYRLMARLVEVPLIDGVGDFRLLSRRAVDALLRLDEATRFSKGLFAWIGFPTTTITYEDVERVSGRSRWSLGQLLDYGLDGAMSFNTKPLRLSIWLGLAAVALSLGYFVWLLVQVLFDGVSVPGYLTLVGLMSGLAGVQLIFLGVLGEYVGRIFLETKRRPHFIVAREVRAAESRGSAPRPEPHE
jgi:glycosyltransferase involved in cell wall biosynthesis